MVEKQTGDGSTTHSLGDDSLETGKQVDLHEKEKELHKYDVKIVKMVSQVGTVGDPITYFFFKVEIKDEIDVYRST